MDELTLLREFRSAVDAPTHAARERARATFARRGRQPGRRFTLVLVAGFGVAVVLAATALGLGERVYDFIVGAPAPPPVKREISLLERPRGEILRQLRANPDIVEERAYAAVVLQSSLGPVYLWVAPNRRGGSCGFLDLARERGTQGMAGLSGGCWPGRRIPLIASLEDRALGGRRVRVLYGRVLPGVAQVDMEPRGARTRRVQLHDRYFLVEVPLAQTPGAVVARDASGRVVARQRLFDPSATPVLEPPAAPFRTVLAVRTENGRIARIRIAPARSGGRCIYLEFAGTRGGGCGSRRIPGLSAFPTQIGAAERATVFVQGVAGPEIASVLVRFEDGQVTRAPYAEGVFLLPIPRDRFVAGRRPSAVIGLDARGKRVASTRLGPYG